MAKGNGATIVDYVLPPLFQMGECLEDPRSSGLMCESGKLAVRNGEIPRLAFVRPNV